MKRTLLSTLHSSLSTLRSPLSLLLVFALFLGLLSSCGSQEAPSAPTVSIPSSYDPAASVPSPAPAEEPSVTDLAEAVFPYSGCKDPDNVQRVNAGEDAGALAFYIENAYKLEEGTWEDAAIIRATGASAFEVAVLRCPDGDAAVRAAANLASYIFARQGDFTGYAPAEADMASKGGIAQNGPFAALFICPEPDLASTAFDAILEGAPMPALPDSEASAEPSAEPAPGSGPSAAPPAVPTPEPSAEPSAEPSDEPPAASLWPDRVPFTQPNKDDMSLYDTSAIRAAWGMGDPSRLSDYDKAIYSAAKSVLDKTVKSGMTDLEKETALYQWIVQNVNYDWTHQNVMVATPRESFTPYGGLVNRTAVCLGYAATFQLLMDLAGVECITVAGAAFRSTEDHGWNMVRLNGNWYCVDSTWDANWREQGVNRGRPRDWNYFNVTSDYMAATDHQWDYENTPEAVTE